jgi:hypothetical protein
MGTAAATHLFGSSATTPDTAGAALSRSVPIRAAHVECRSDPAPEKRLMIAVVRDAVRCIEKYRHARDILGRQRFLEETRWILTNDRARACTFARICEALDLDPDAVRRSLGLTAAGKEDRPMRASSSRVTDLSERRVSC